MLNQDNNRQSEESAEQTPSCCPSLHDAKRDDVESATLPSRESELAGVVEIFTTALAAPSALDVTLTKVVDILRSFLPMRHGIISLFNSHGELEIFGAGSSESRRVPQKAIDQIMRAGTPLVTENIAFHSAFTAADTDVLGVSNNAAVSFIGVPIRVDADVVGTLTIDHVLGEDPRAWLDHNLYLLNQIANLVGQTVKFRRSLGGSRQQPLAQHDLQPKQNQPARPRNKIHIEGMIGDSLPFRGLIENIQVVAKLKIAVLLRGESGTGKEKVAKALHDLSPRAKRPFIKLNCAALSETVLESELFGHEKGAFTSAFNSRKGRFELADKGTLFLDEIGEISPSFQAKLLRVLQEQEFERVGGNQTVKVDVRIIAATNKNLEEAVARNEFREDLYYRINVFTVRVPALRERRSDIPLLAAEFLKNFNDENGVTMTLDPGAVEVLMNCDFPGNIRELQNCVYRTAVLAMGASIGRGDFACCQGQCFAAALHKVRSDSLALQSRPMLPAPGGAAITPAAAGTSPSVAVPPETTGEPPLSRIAHLNGTRTTGAEAVIAAMERCGWVQAKAARLLGLTPRQIGYTLRKYGIEIKRL
ncbi:nif-specific transcriptional activator NifA [Mesorhizobium sp. B283B1A]|uniref:nif-specific transcriptional activator NifA n=1 Tax=Mesorhizobium TaxID=68287 RepID=UPI001CD0C22A|nr:MULTISPECIES: nif-specific transcriptional activator NifA [Mesorhizobium]MCA0045925.1 nif-specific transcriptional activator NifA [Mesorhizobium sp. B283B1A]UQS64667.1 nif-specific transcriptional activator NifA [Mesorhizobium opportunistum]